MSESWLTPDFFNGSMPNRKRSTTRGISACLFCFGRRGGSSDYTANLINPGLTLPEDQAILLERYMVARWGAQHVLWILNGDGIYKEDAAERWRRIGRAVFGDRPHAPVTLHPGGGQWNYDEFKTEEWLDIWGYQSSHSVDERASALAGQRPAATDWGKPPAHPVINLEPPYEGHNDMSAPGKRRISPHDVRRGFLFQFIGLTHGRRHVRRTRRVGLGRWHKITDRASRNRDSQTMVRGVANARRQSDEISVRFLWVYRVVAFAAVSRNGRRPAGHIARGRNDCGGENRRGRFSGDLHAVAEQNRIESLIALTDSLRAEWFNPVNGERTPAHVYGHARTCRIRDAARRRLGVGAAVNILIIGGTGLISAPITRMLVERGIAVTLFNRGKPDLYPAPRRV